MSGAGKSSEARVLHLDLDRALELAIELAVERTVGLARGAVLVRARARGPQEVTGVGGIRHGPHTAQPGGKRTEVGGVEETETEVGQASTVSGRGAAGGDAVREGADPCGEKSGVGKAVEAGKFHLVRGEIKQEHSQTTKFDLTSHTIRQAVSAPSQVPR